LYVQQLKRGVFDVLPSGALDGLTSEDLRLLLNGVGDINVQQLSAYTTFNDESGVYPFN
jgi:E3 ubiquitin-protein ligase EDD1